MQELKLNPIKWVSGNYGFEYGYIKGIQLFSVGYNEKSTYKLVCSLPQLKPFIADTQEKAKVNAERMIINYIKYLLVE